MNGNGQEGSSSETDHIDSAVRNGDQNEGAIITETEYKTIFETVEDAVFVFDVEHDGEEPSFSFRRNNSAHERITDITVDEFIGKSPQEILGAEEGAEVLVKYHRCVEAEETIEYEETLDHSTGKVEWHTKLTPIFEDGKVTEIIGVARDITKRKAYEDELKRKRERLRALFEEAPDGIVIHDADGRVIDVNKTICEQLGYKRPELLSMDVFDFDVGLNESEIKSKWQKMDPGSMQRLEVEGLHRHKDGSTFPVEVWVSKVRSSEDESDSFVALVRDITERKKYENRLSTLHDATRRIIDAESKEEVAEITVDAAKDLLDFSLPSVWYPTDDGKSLTLVSNSPEHQALLEDAGTPEPTHSSESWLWDAIEADETIVQSPIPTEYLAADVPLQSAIILPLGKQGILACGSKGEIAFTDREISVAEILARNVRSALDQLDQRAAIKHQIAFTNDLLDAIEDVVYVLDNDGNLEEWNVALETVTGYSGKEIEAMNASDFFPAKDAGAVHAAVKEGFETGQIRIELDFLTATGESIPYEFIANTFEDPTGGSVMAGIGRNRSVHVEYEKTLEEQRDNLEMLNQVVRHDIRNDMTVVKGRANLLNEYIDTEGQEHLEPLLRATENAIELTKTARDLSDTMLSTEEDVESVRIEQHLLPSIENARMKFDDAVITVEDRVPDIRVMGNDLLETVFWNLIQNAVVHNNKESPNVEISIAVDVESAKIAIADNGPGVPDDHKETIFGKGEKGLDSPGTGIGLYLVRTLVDRYGGGVWVEDNEPEGSVFYVELPRAKS